MAKFALPLLSKWACLYSVKGRARHLDIFAIYADTSLAAAPFGSINLDAPLVLLNPTHPEGNRTRPSNIAMACDLLADMTSYRLLRLAEDYIAEKGLFEALEPLLFVPSQLDDQLLPERVHVMHYSEALAALRSAATAPESPKLKP